MGVKNLWWGTGVKPGFLCRNKKKSGNFGRNLQKIPKIADIAPIPEVSELHPAAGDSPSTLEIFPDCSALRGSLRSEDSSLEKGS